MIISIITINLNNSEGLRKTLESVAGQTYPGIEHIVIDGRSTDGSPDLIARHAGHLAYTVSERDSGIYNAMNKGIAHAKGNYCLFLNSGDYLYQNTTIRDAVQLMSNQSQTDCFYGDFFYQDKLITSPATLDLAYLSCDSLPHCATFIATKLFRGDSIGLYNEQLKITSDWLFFLQAYITQKVFKHIHLPVAVFEGGGISNQYKLTSAERSDIVKQFYPNFIADFKHFAELRSYKFSRLHQAVGVFQKFFKKTKH